MWKSGRVARQGGVALDGSALAVCEAFAKEGC